MPKIALVVAPGGTVVAGPLSGEKGYVLCDVDLDSVITARSPLNITGHYARPNRFTLDLNKEPQQSFRVKGDYV